MTAPTKAQAEAAWRALSDDERANYVAWINRRRFKERLNRWTPTSRAFDAALELMHAAAEPEAPCANFIDVDMGHIAKTNDDEAQCWICRGVFGIDDVTPLGGACKECDRKLKIIGERP